MASCFFFAAGVVAPFVHNLCTFGFFCYLYIVAFYRSKKKKKITFKNHDKDQILLFKL